MKCKNDKNFCDWDEKPHRTVGYTKLVEELTIYTQPPHKFILYMRSPTQKRKKAKTCVEESD